MWRGLLLGVLVSTSASAHTLQCNATAVPDWIQKSCCGQADAHIIQPSQIHSEGDYYIIDGVGRKKIKETLPSQDGCYWAFYPNVWTCGSGSASCRPGPVQDSQIYCLLIPMDM